MTEFPAVRPTMLLLCVATATAGCASVGPLAAPTDALRERLLAREDLGWQQLLIERSPGLDAAGAAWNYTGPAVEPPLPEPDLSLMPEELPVWTDSVPASP